MSAAILRGSSRDPFMPQMPKVRGRAIALALLAHVLLFLGLMFGVDWRSNEPPTVAAELWSATPQAAAPRAVEPPPTAPVPEVKKVEPVVTPTPKPPEPVAEKPPAPAVPDPQIAIERAKREEAKRAAAEQEELKKQKREKEELAQKKAEREKAEKAKAAKDKTEQAKAEQAQSEKAQKAEAARLAAIRDQQMKRLAGLAGATGGPTDSGDALHSSGPSANYAGRVAARVKPNILFTDTIDGNPQAVVQVRLAPDGTIIGKRLVQSSGVKAWDDAVLRAIERTEILPLDNGRAPPPFVEIGFRPHD